MPDQKIVVIGDEDAVFGLGLLGMEGHAVATVDEARQAIERALADPNIALILLTENWAAARPESIGDAGPLLVEIPAHGPATPSLALEMQIERALGVRLER
jgi:V/A-type H+/Na+-transporting ATPase subunit F